jgi:hypothetical protein
MSLLKRLALITALMLPAAALAAGPYQNINPLQPYLNVIAPNTLDGVAINPTNAAAGNFSTLNTAATTPQGTVFSTAMTGNPLVLDNYTDTPVASLTSATMTTIIASTAGRTIYPVNVTLMVSGTAATATALALECSDGTLIANWPIALLLTNNPQGAYSSTVVTRGTALGKGCPASTAVMLSNVGTNITTTTHVYTNVLETVQ